MVCITPKEIDKSWIYFNNDIPCIKGGIKKVVNQYRHTHVCEMCGKRDSKKNPLTFHHTDPSIKSMSISDMKYHGAPLNRFLAEVNTCQLLCRDCHDKIDNHIRKITDL